MTDVRRRDRKVALKWRPKTIRRKRCRPENPKPIEYSPCKLAEIALAIQNWRIGELSDVQIAHRLMKASIVPPDSYTKWSVFAVKGTLQKAALAT